MATNSEAPLKMDSGQGQVDTISESFDIVEETYKTAGSHAIQTAVLTPKNLAPGRHPVIINVHGGYLVHGDAVSQAFFPQWVLDLAATHAAILVSPDYRLVPSARGVADVLEDLEAFWTWTRAPAGAGSGLTTLLARRDHVADLDRLLLVGHSAGGYAVAQLALAHPAQARALALVDPLLDIKDPRFVDGPAPGPDGAFAPLMGVPADRLPSAAATRAWIADARPVVRSRAGLELTPLALAAVRHGLLYRELYDNSGANDPAFNPIERLRAGAVLPPHVWIMHGEADSIVHLRQSTDFADFVTAHLPGTVLRVDVAKGQDHGFEAQIPPTIWEAEHAPGAFDFVKRAWLGL